MQTLLNLLAGVSLLDLLVAALLTILCYSSLAENTQDSIETSSLHLDLISDLKRINSHISSIAYPILEQAGVLAKTRLKEPDPVPLRAT